MWKYFDNFVLASTEVKNETFTACQQVDLAWRHISALIFKDFSIPDLLRTFLSDEGRHDQEAWRWSFQTIYR